MSQGEPKEGSIYYYGNQVPYVFDKYWVEGSGLVKNSPLALERPTIKDEDYYQALEDINRSWRTIEDPESNKTFEVAVANLEASPDAGVVAELSTFTSSVSGNPGNAVELAESAALHPDRQRLYIASFGNGGSSYWTSKEQKHIKQTGKFTRPHGEALPTLEALARALKATDLPIARFSANSAGGAHATALMASLPEGQVSHAYLKSRPNISNHGAGIAWGVRVLMGDILDDRKYHKASQDPWKLTKAKVDDAKQHLPGIYSEQSQNRHKSLLQKAQSSHTAGKIRTDLKALSRGGADKNYPAAQDTVAAVRQQPEAAITFHFPAQDLLYKNMPEEVVEFLEMAHLIGATALGSGQLVGLVAPGRHRDHTHYPGLRWAAEKYAFNRR